MLDARILFQDIDHRHQLGDSGLVIRSEKRSSVGRDDVVADQILEIGFCATVMTCVLSFGRTMSPP
jgi:hypothetical protein